MRTLYGLLQSPWTEKARWSLDHHSVAYRYHEHVPVLGEVLLRMKARTRPKGTKASVPLLVDGKDVACSSLAIAQYAEEIGRGEPLFADREAAAVERWASLSDRIIAVGRMRVLAALRSNRAAQRESVPDFVPGPLRGAFSPMTLTASWFLGSKYDVSTVTDEAAAEGLRPMLDEVRGALGNRPHLLEGFSFADVAVAASLQALRPRKRAPLGPGTREIWSFDALARDYEDLLSWRDATYAKHRPGG